MLLLSYTAENYRFIHVPNFFLLKSVFQNKYCFTVCSRMIMWPTNSKGLEGGWLLVSPSNWTKKVLQFRGTYKWKSQLMGNCILFQESCVVALDMYKYEQSNEFQYADSLVKLQEKWQAVAMTTWTHSTEECKLLDDISGISHLYMRVPKTLTFKMRLCAKPFIWKLVLCAWNNFKQWFYI